MTSLPKPQQNTELLSHSRAIRCIEGNCIALITQISNQYEKSYSKKESLIKNDLLNKHTYEIIDSESNKRFEKLEIPNDKNDTTMHLSKHSRNKQRLIIQNDSEFKYIYETLSDEDQSSCFYSYDSSSESKNIPEKTPNDINDDKFHTFTITKQPPIFIQRKPKPKLNFKKQKEKQKNQDQIIQNEENISNFSLNRKFILRRINILEEKLKNLQSSSIAMDNSSIEIEKVGTNTNNISNLNTYENGMHSSSHILDTNKTEENDNYLEELHHTKNSTSNSIKVSKRKNLANRYYSDSSSKSPHLVFQAMNNDSISIINENAVEDFSPLHKIDLQISSVIKSEKVNNLKNTSSATFDSNHGNNKDNDEKEIKDRSIEIKNEKRQKTIKKIYRKVKVSKPKKEDKDSIDETLIMASSPKKIKNILNIQYDETDNDATDLNDSELAKLNPIQAKEYTNNHSTNTLNKKIISRKIDKRSIQNNSLVYDQDSNDDNVKIKIVEDHNIPDVDRFCILYIEGDRQSAKKTKTIESGQNLYNESFEFKINESSPSKLIFFLKKENLLKVDKIMGTAKIDLKKLPPNQTLNKWVSLKTDSGLKTESKVHLILKRTTKLEENKDCEEFATERSSIFETKTESNYSYKSYEVKNYNTNEPQNNEQDYESYEYESFEIESNPESRELHETKTNSLSEYSENTPSNEILSSNSYYEKEEMPLIQNNEELSEFDDKEEPYSKDELSESRKEEQLSNLSNYELSEENSNNDEHIEADKEIHISSPITTTSNISSELHSSSFFDINEKAIKLHNDSHESIFFVSSNSKLSNVSASGQKSLVFETKPESFVNQSNSSKSPLHDAPLSPPLQNENKFNSDSSSPHSRKSFNKSEKTEILNTPSIPSEHESSNILNEDASNLTSVSSHSISDNDDYLNFNVSISFSSNESNDKVKKTDRQNKIMSKDVNIKFDHKKSSNDDNMKQEKDEKDGKSSENSLTSNISNTLSSSCDIKFNDFQFIEDEVVHNFNSEFQSDSNLYNSEKDNSYQKKKSLKNSDSPKSSNKKSYRLNSNINSIGSPKKNSSKKVPDSLEFSDENKESRDASKIPEKIQPITNSKKKSSNIGKSNSELLNDDNLKSISSSLDSENISGPLHDKFLHNYTPINNLTNSPRNLLDPHDLSSFPESHSHDNFISSNGTSDSLNLASSDLPLSKKSRNFQNSKNDPQDLPNTKNNQKLHSRSQILSKSNYSPTLKSEQISTKSQNLDKFKMNLSGDKPVIYYTVENPSSSTASIV